MVLMGMSTDEWDVRVRETGPVQAHRGYVNPFSVAETVAKIKEANGRGVVAVWSDKFPGSWADVAAGRYDAHFRELGAALAKIPGKSFGSLHHEPRGNGIETPQQLLVWARANARAIGIIKAELGVGSGHLIGVLDNGHPWSSQPFAKLTDADLAVYYIPELLRVVDYLGADFYDGRSDTKPGEPAAVKMRNFQAWAKRIGFTGPLVAGEWNAITADDIRAAWAVLKTWPAGSAACLFNSSRNNRPDLPTTVGLGTPPSWVLKGERLAAFKVVLAEARVEPDPEEPPVDPTDPRDAEIADLKRQLALALEAGDRADQVAEEQRARAEAAETRAAGLQAEVNTLTDERDRLVGAVRNIVQLGSSVLPA